MIDTDALRQAVQSYKFYARPSNATCGTPATVDDINNLIDYTAKLMYTLIAEIEKISSDPFRRRVPPAAF